MAVRKKAEETKARPKSLTIRIENLDESFDIISIIEVASLWGDVTSINTSINIWD